MDTKKYEDQMPVDEGLQGNETIEEAILALQQEPTEEILAHTLTVIRRRARANGQFIVAVIPPVVRRAVCRSRRSRPRMSGTGGWHLPALMRR